MPAIDDAKLEVHKHSSHEDRHLTSEFTQLDFDKEKSVIRASEHFIWNYPNVRAIWNEFRIKSAENQSDKEDSNASADQSNREENQENNQTEEGSMFQPIDWIDVIIIT